MTARVVPIPSDTMPHSGRWVWKEEPPGLEYVSNQPAFDKGKRGKKFDSKKDRTTSGREYGKLRTGPPIVRVSNIKKDALEHTQVLVEDIKSVAFYMMSEIQKIPEAFEGLMRAVQFDYFLLHLMSYFKCFFEKLVIENKKHPMFIEQSLTEKKALANAIEKAHVAMKLLGRSYCSLVIGTGLTKEHHMECGQSRVSYTLKDRSIFETFYSYCTFVVWITFRRKEFETIKKEIGRILRSNTFNPCIRVPHAVDDSHDESKEDQRTLVSASQYRRTQPKRPPITSILNQRSPAVVSILPTPKEESHGLFIKLSSDEEGLFQEVEHLEERFSDLIIDAKTFKIGILGEPYNLYNPITLTPVGGDNEDEQAGTAALPLEEGGAEKVSEAEGSTGKAASVTDPESSRLPTAISQTTTNAEDIQN